MCSATAIREFHYSPTGNRLKWITVERVWKVKLILRVHYKSQEGNNSLRVNNNSLLNRVTSDCTSTIQRIQFICIWQNHIYFLSNNTLKCIESVTGTQALHIILSFEVKSYYIIRNYKVLTIIDITVQVCVDITVKFENPILLHPAYSE